MEIVDLRTPPDELAPRVLDALRRGPVIAPLPRVFTIAALPNAAGARALDALKERLPGKTYSTGVADPARLAALVDRSAVDASVVGSLPHMRDAILRLPVAPPSVSAAAVARGMHQALLLEGALRAVFLRVEDAIARAEELSEPAIFGGARCCSPLFTSCNRSGDPAGTITRLDDAIAFGRARGAAMLLRGEPTADALGSFPVVAFARDTWWLCREGPGLDAFAARLPRGLRRVDPPIDDAGDGLVGVGRR
jgi:hypothetical protein